MNTTSLTLRRTWNANTLKMIAVIAMVIDHLTWAFIPTASLPGQILHAIGRLTAPIMAFFVAEGYYHTHNLKRYAQRLAIFSVLSIAPFYYETNGHWPIEYVDGHFTFFYYNDKVHLISSCGVILSLFLGLLTLIIWDHVKHYMNRILLIILCCIVALLADWYFIVTLYVFFFGIYREERLAKEASNKVYRIPPKWSAYIILSLSFCITGIFFNNPWYYGLFQFGVLLAIPVLNKYNGQRGTMNLKWFFYLFYPLHLLLLGFLRYEVFR